MNCSFNLSASIWLTSCNKIKDSPSFPLSFLAHHQTKLSNSIVPQMWLWDGEMNWKFNGCWGQKFYSTNYFYYFKVQVSCLHHSSFNVVQLVELLHILEVPGSNLDQKTDNLNRFSLTFFTHSEQCVHFPYSSSCLHHYISFSICHP